MNGRRDLVVGFELDGRGFARGADMVSNRMDRMGRESRDFGSTASKGFGRANRGLLELSRGAEDFAVSFGTGGVAGGFRGAANNISQFASMIHPLAGALAGLGVAGVSMWMAFNKGADTAANRLKAIKAETARLKSEFTELQSKQGHEIGLRQARGEIDDFGAKRQRFDDARGVMERTGEQLSKTRKFLADARADLEHARGPDGSRERWGELIGTNRFTEKKERIANLEAREKQLSELFDDAASRAEDARRPFAVADAARLRAGVVGEGAGINQQRREFSASLEARRKAAADRKQRFLDEQRERSLRPGGTLNVMGPMSQTQAPQTSAPPGLASIASKGSAGAARAIAEAKNQSNIQKQHLDVAKQQLEELKKSSQVGQADVVIESFSGVA